MVIHMPCTSFVDTEREGLMGCHTVAFPTAGLHADEAETSLYEGRFIVDTGLPAIEYVDECSCLKNHAC